mgnify:CR=1 FL=1
MTPVSPLKHKYPLRARDKLSICTDLYRLCVINISLIGSIGKRVPQVSRLQVKLRLQDSGMDSVVPQITLQAICHLFLKLSLSWSVFGNDLQKCVMACIWLMLLLSPFLKGCRFWYSSSLLGRWSRWSDVCR